MHGLLRRHLNMLRVPWVPLGEQLEKRNTMLNDPRHDFLPPVSTIEEKRVGPQGHGCVGVVAVGTI